MATAPQTLLGSESAAHQETDGWQELGKPLGLSPRGE